VEETVQQSFFLKVLSCMSALVDCQHQRNW